MLAGFCSKSPFLIALVRFWREPPDTELGRIEPFSKVKPEMAKVDKTSKVKARVSRTRLGLDVAMACSFSSAGKQ